MNNITIAYGWMWSSPVRIGDAIVNKVTMAVGWRRSSRRPTASAGDGVTRHWGRTAWIFASGVGRFRKCARTVDGSGELGWREGLGRHEQQGCQHRHAAVVERPAPATQYDPHRKQDQELHTRDAHAEYDERQDSGRRYGGHVGGSAAPWGGPGRGCGAVRQAHARAQGPRCVGRALQEPASCRTRWAVTKSHSCAHACRSTEI